MEKKKTSRRSFIKTSALAALGTVSMPAILQGSINNARKENVFLNKLTVRKNRATTLPVGPYVCGHFIEDGFGSQTEGMRAEMLYNRAFKEHYELGENIYGALNIHKDVYGPSRAFWHSGYECCDWKPIGGEAGARMSRTIGNCSFMDNDSLRLITTRENGGLTQDRIWLDESKTYTFQLAAMCEGRKYSAPLPGYPEERSNRNPPVPLNVIFTDETSGKVVYQGLFTIRPVVEPHELKFNTNGFTGWTCLSLTTDKPSHLILSWSSLRADDHIDGWRPDVVELLKSIKPSVIRFPGGCYASFFDWREGVRPRESRSPKYSYYWGGLHANEAGLDDYVNLCDRVGAEPQVLVRMMTGTPFEAYEMVQYLNGADNTHMGKLRKMNGVTQKRKVKLFEMENEAGRKWPPLQYAEEVVKYAVAMREADPDIKLMMEVYSYGLAWLEQMLEVAGKQVNYVITRSLDKERLIMYLDVLRKYNKSHSTDIKLSNSEWLPNPNWIRPFDDPEYPQLFNWEIEPQTDDRKNSRTRMIRWFYALNAATTMIDFMSLGGEFELANFNNCCNTWGGNVIEAAKETAWLSPAGLIMGFFPGCEGMWPLESTLEQAPNDKNKNISSVALQKKDGGVCIYFVNRSDKSETVSLDIPGKFQSGECLYADNPLARTRPDGSDIHRKAIAVSGKIIKLPKYSLTKIEYS
jgi:hypothetical protein